MRLQHDRRDRRRELGVRQDHRAGEPTGLDELCNMGGLQSWINQCGDCVQALQSEHYEAVLPHVGQAGRPIVVLSNNDGCTVARSQEAKALGIAMGVPLFQAKRLVERHDVTVLSSNYALYGDLSERVMSILTAEAPRIEVYSIDESFLDLDRLAVPDLTR